MDPDSHVGFQINAKNTNLVENLPMNISGKYGSNLFCGFREEDLNVKRKRTDDNDEERRTDYGRLAMTKAQMAYGQVS